VNHVSGRGILAVFWVATSGGGPRVGTKIDSGTPDSGDVVTLSMLQEKIFTPKCAQSSCHLGKPPPQAPMSLQTGRSHSELVSAPSIQATSLLRIDPKSISNSYLIHKVRGTSMDVGGSPTRMPLMQTPLEESEIVMIETWILRGAPND
jgi:hypothetical protein